MRKTVFQNKYNYHIYNRGTEKRDIFVDENDYVRFLVNLREMNNESKYEERMYYKKIDEDKAKKELNSKALELSSFLASLPKLVEIIAYCFNPNHFHLLLKQKQEKGIEKFMHRIGTGYTNYFNTKYKRSGSLFQGRYKSIVIDTDEYLDYLSAYINANPEIHKISTASNYKWSSYQDYLGLRNGTLCNKEIVERDFENVSNYKKYVQDVIIEARQNKQDKKELILE